MNIYRNIQEIVNNSIKYNDAKAIAVQAKKEGKQTIISIKDNGSSLDQLSVKKRNGLYNMQKRLR